jgi:hypothetical protein
VRHLTHLRIWIFLDVESWIHCQRVSNISLLSNLYSFGVVQI